MWVQLSQSRKLGRRNREDQTIAATLAERGVDCWICGTDRLGVGSDHEDRALEVGRREHPKSPGEIGKAHGANSKGFERKFQPKLT